MYDIVCRGQKSTLTVIPEEIFNLAFETEPLTASLQLS